MSPFPAKNRPTGGATAPGPARPRSGGDRYRVAGATERRFRARFSGWSW